MSIRCSALPAEGYNFHHGICRRGQDHGASEAGVRGGEAAAVSCLRAGFAHGLLQGKSGFSPYVQTVFTRGEVRLLSI